MAVRTKSHPTLPLRRHLALADHPNLYFWLLFAGLNSLLFLPSYLLNTGSVTFFPDLGGTTAEPARWARQLFLWRNNLDIFRLSAEFTILLALWALLPWSRFPRLKRPFRWLLAITYLLALLYAIYESVTIYTYQVDAVFYAHARMVVDGLGFLLRHLDVQIWQIAALLLAIAAAAVILLALIRAIAGGIESARLSLWSKAALALLASLALLSMIQYRGSLASPKSAVSSLLFKLQKNTAASFALYNRVQSLDGLAYDQLYDYAGHDLLATPDIYLIFIESYGSILTTEPAFFDPYTNLLADLSERLAQGGWSATTALSESPTWGGGSWMAYTSAIFGLRIDSHPQYIALLERFQEDDFPDLGRTLQAQGYEYVFATSLAAELPDEKWQEYVNFYGVDRWIRYSDLDYQGMHYGWGPSPPDQYVLNAVHQELNADGPPFLLFWITQNSHYPWRTVPKVVDDWRAMNDGRAVVTIFDDDQTSLSTKRENYFEAIRYELDFLTDFILKEADDDAIFVLIGDHQPGYVTRRSDGFATPLHIISKDSAFLANFAAYGFEPGLQAQDPSPAVRHEGFYSLFMRALLAHYGHGAGQLPPYFAEGVQLPSDN